MRRKVAKVGAVKTDRNRSRRGWKVGVSCMCGLLVARGPGCGATSRIIPRREEVAIPHAYLAKGQSAKPELSRILLNALIRSSLIRLQITRMRPTGESEDSRAG